MSTQVQPEVVAVEALSFDDAWSLIAAFRDAERNLQRWYRREVPAEDYDQIRAAEEATTTALLNRLMGRAS